jgi:hypothetical protein
MSRCHVSLPAGALFVLIACASASAFAADTPPLETLLERAGAYVDRYAETFRDVVAEESYRQWWNDPRSSALVARTLRSDMVFAVVPGPLPWTTFRDVFEVDGNAVRDREDRLERLFIDSPRSAVEQAQAILRESSRHNVAPPLGQGGQRTINVPTLALLFLQPENQKRLSFERKGTRSFDGLETVEIRFVEEASPTLIHDDWLNDVPARGRFWVEPRRGIVVRTEVEYDLEPESRERRQVAFVSTLYAREDGLDIFVPSEMKELWTLPSGRIEGTARYSNYRRFRVTTEEKDAREAPPQIGVAAPQAATQAVDLEMGTPSTPPPRVASSPGIGVAPPKPPGHDLEAAPPLPGEIGTVLQRAGTYVLGYEDAFRTVGASEQLREWYSGTTTEVRTLRSDVVFAMAAGPSPWVLYRDVVQVGGHDLHEDDHRLQRLFRESPGGAPREAVLLQRESERQLRPPERGMWVPLTVPTAALAYLHPDNRDRFRFELKERSTRDGDEVVALEFEEVARPTLVRDGAGQDLPARGTLVVRQEDGALLSSDVELRFVSGRDERMRVTTRFKPDPRLGLLVPVEMRQVVAPASSGGWADPEDTWIRAEGRLETVLRYSEYESLSGGRR